MFAQVERAEHAGFVGGLNARERCVNTVRVVGDAVFLELPGVHGLSVVLRPWSVVGRVRHASRRRVQGRRAGDVGIKGDEGMELYVEFRRWPSIRLSSGGLRPREPLDAADGDECGGDDPPGEDVI